MLFLTRHLALNFIKKPLCYEVLINSESTNAFFSNLEGRCETLHEVPRSRPATRFKCSYGHSRYRLQHFEHKSHVSKPCKPVHVSPDLSTFEVSDFFLLVRTWCMVFWEAYPPVFFLRSCAWMSVPDNNTENHVVVLRELSWLPGNKLARFSAAETLEPAPVNLENVTQKLHSMKTPPGKTQSRRVSQRDPMV